ncbi:hypothetical protein MMC22_007134 [Lobaria immixta]|nr:hypothetical protein [Lobaria immixta]
MAELCPSPPYQPFDGTDDGEFLLDSEVEGGDEETVQSNFREKGQSTEIDENQSAQISYQSRTSRTISQNPNTNIATSTKGILRKNKRALVTGEVASDGTTSKGEINRLPDGGLQWNDGGTWGKSGTDSYSQEVEFKSEIGVVSAVYHDTLRPQLIQQMDTLGSYGESIKYLPPNAQPTRAENLRSRGYGEWDVTSYHPDQRTWGPSRYDHWPFMPDKLLFRLECNGYPVPEYRPGLWYDQGRLVLDLDNKPVKKWKNIPLTLSSNADPWLLENIRREDTRITLKDLRARMPIQQLTKKGVLKPLGTLSSLGMQLTRFRLRAACPAWNEREGSNVIRDYIKGLLSPEGLAANSTEELPGLAQWQQDESRKPNKGLYPKRAGDRALSTEERKKRKEAISRRLQETGAQISEVNVIPNKPKPGRPPSGRARSTSPPSPPPPSIRVSPLHVPTMRVSGHKRSRADSADSEDGESASFPKRRNLGKDLDFVDPPQPLLKTRHLSKPSASRRLDVSRSQPEAKAQNSDETMWASQEPSSLFRNTAAPENRSTAFGLVQRAMPTVFSPANLPGTGDQSFQRKRSYTLRAEPEDAEDFPVAKRRRVQGFTRSRDCSVQSSPDQSINGGNLSESPITVFPENNSLAQTQLGRTQNDQASISGEPGPVEYGKIQSVDFNDWQTQESTNQECPEDVIGKADYRCIRPTSRRESRSVAEALVFTRLDYQWKMGLEAPETPEDECYAIQHNIIHNAARGAWLQDSEPPALYCLPSWTGGFDNWHKLKPCSPVSSSHFGS